MPDQVNDKLNPNRIAAISYHLHKAAGRTQDADALSTQMTAKLGAELWAQLLANTEQAAQDDMLENDLGQLQAQVFRAIREKPRTIWEIQTEVQRSPVMAWRYLKELESRGLIEEVPKMWRVKTSK